MSFHVFRSAALANRRQPVAVLGNKCAHAVTIDLEIRSRRVDTGVKNVHHARASAALSHDRGLDRVRRTWRGAVERAQRRCGRVKCGYEDGCEANFSNSERVTSVRRSSSIEQATYQL